MTLTVPRYGGLSPHMRGNPDDPQARQRTLGSIPAHAGEPRRWRKCTAACGVYPRTCGGTGVKAANRDLQRGLSPHMRGKPLQPRSDKIRLMVYPRTCGGTRDRRRVICAGIGLSPHMRGNQQLAHPAFLQRRSIPAHAGEPTGCPPIRRRNAVYPRTCGGTHQSVSRPIHVNGLSPHMRGNPLVCWPGSSGSWVYPRTCGGTSLPTSLTSSLWGLSPHMRGNPGEMWHQRA